MSILFFSPISKISNDSVVVDSLTQNFCISQSAVKRNKSAAQAVKMNLVSPIQAPYTPIAFAKSQEETFITPVNPPRSQKDPDTPRPMKIKSVGVYMIPFKL